MKTPQQVLAESVKVPYPLVKQPFLTELRAVDRIARDWRLSCLKRVLLALCALLSACASAPADLARINTLGNAHPYVHYTGFDLNGVHYKGYDMHPLAPGAGGNCSAIAFTKFPLLLQAGYSPMVRTCLLMNGQHHLYLVVDGWALDNRYSMPVREWQVGCRD
jgi:hypothetical protein